MSLPPQNPFEDQQDPYRPPQFDAAGGGVGDGGDPMAKARGWVKGPAIALMVLAPIGIIVMLVDLGFRIVNLAAGDVPVMVDGPGAAEGAKIGAALGGVFNVVAMICHGVMAYGAFNMMNLRNYSLSMAASIIAVVPCISPACILGIPFGIWGIVALVNADVKAAFVKNASSTSQY